MAGDIVSRSRHPCKPCVRGTKIRGSLHDKNQSGRVITGKKQPSSSRPGRKLGSTSTAHREKEVDPSEPRVTHRTARVHLNTRAVQKGRKTTSSTRASAHAPHKLFRLSASQRERREKPGPSLCPTPACVNSFTLARCLQIKNLARAAFRL
jgi:hypothetical protein